MVGMERDGRKIPFVFIPVVVEAVVAMVMGVEGSVGIVVRGVWCFGFGVHWLSVRPE